VPSSMPTGSPPEPDDSRYRSDHVPRFANEEEAERWKRSMLDELRELHQGGHLQPASTPEETPPQGEPFRLIYQRLVPSVLPAERPRLRLVYAKGYEPGQVGPRSKTGDADCSAATSAWKSGRATPETHKQLAKCRAMTKTAKQATLQRAAGNEAKAQALEHRVASKGPLTAKARREEATKRVQERAGRNQSRAERQAAAAEQTEQARVAAAGEPPPENHEEQARQAAVAAIRAHRARPSPETRVAAETAFAHHQEVSGGKDPFAPERPTPIPGSKPGSIGYEPDAFERDQMEHAARQAEARAQQGRSASPLTEKEVDSAYIKGVLHPADIKVLTGHVETGPGNEWDTQRVRDHLARQHEEIGKFVSELESKPEDVRNRLDYPKWKNAHDVLGRALRQYDEAQQQPPSLKEQAKAHREARGMNEFARQSMAGRMRGRHEQAMVARLPSAADRVKASFDASGGPRFGMEWIRQHIKASSDHDLEALEKHVSDQPIGSQSRAALGRHLLPEIHTEKRLRREARQAKSPQPRTIKLRRPSPEHRAAVEATAEAIRARGEISRFAENGPGAVAVKAEEYRRKRADAQKAIGAARAAEPGSFPPRPYRSPLEGRQPETGAGLMGTAAPAHDPAHGLSWKMDVGDKRGYRTVHVDVGKVENSFARDEGSHVGPGGKGGIPGRYEEFQRFLHQARTEGTPIEQPRLALSESTGAVAFANGRHRFAVLRDMGAKTIPVTVPLRDARKIQERYGVKGTAAPAIGPRLSEQTAAHRATKGTPAERIARLREVAKGLTRRDFEAGALDRMNQRTDHLSALDRQITGTPELARRRRKAAPKEIRDLRFEEPTTAQRTGTLKRKKATTEASGLTPHERKVLEVLHAEPKGALTPTGDIKERAGIGHIAADRALLSLAEKGHINLHRHDFPHGMTEAEKRRAVVHGGVHYIGAALRSR
jgi:hypothetical protein